MSDPQAGLPRRGFILLLAPWLVFRLAVIWSGQPERSLIADDAYYYFTVAKHMALGLGPTFDTVSPTNGFHPLWQLLLVPLWWAYNPDLWIPVRSALTMSSLFDAASAIVLIQLVQRWTTPRHAMVLGSIWLWSPLTLAVGMRGMEASVSTLTLVILLALVARPSTRTPYIFGVGLALGLSGLARTDNLVTAGLAVAAALLMGSFTRAARWRTLLKTAGVTAIVVFPWFWWNLNTFGSIWQVSGQVKRFVRRGLFGSLPWDFSSVETTFESIGRATFSPWYSPIRFAAGEEFGEQRWTVVLVTMLALATALGLFRFRSRLPGPARAFVLTYIVSHIVTFGFVWHSYVTWYSLPSLLFTTLVLGLDWPSIRTMRGAIATALVATGLIGLWTTVAVRLPHEAAWPEKHFQPTLNKFDQMAHRARLGVFDAGAIGYVATSYEGVTVVNLDCLVNNLAFAALKDGKYLKYVSANVDYVLGNPRRVRALLSPEELEQFVEKYGTPATNQLQ